MTGLLHSQTANVLALKANSTTRPISAQRAALYNLTQFNGPLPGADRGFEYAVSQTQTPSVD